MMALDRDLMRQVGIMLRPIAARAVNTIARGVVSLIDDSETMQRIQIVANLDEVIEGQAGGAEHFQPYGFFSVPMPGAQAVLVCLGGDRSHPIAVVVADRRYRPVAGQPGEVGLRTDEGDELRFGRGHAVTLATSGSIQLGSSTAATHGVIKGDTRNAAEQTFLSALGAFTTALGGLPGMTGPAATFNAAVATFASAVTAAISVKVKVE